MRKQQQRRLGEGKGGNNENYGILSRLCCIVILLVSCYNFHQRVIANHKSNNGGRLTRHKTGRQRTGEKQESNGTKLLYIMTTLAEYDNGKRSTVKGHDRFLNTLLPVARQSVVSMAEHFQVDFYLISHFSLTESRLSQLRIALPKSVNLTVWDNASPISYDVKDRLSSNNNIQEITRSLARQHRFVVKDMLHEYDMFVCFEDDMIITSEHVKQFMSETAALNRLKMQAATYTVPGGKNIQVLDMHRSYSGPMTVEQLSRMVPGFIRVEAALPDFHKSGSNLLKQRMENNFEQVPGDFQWNGKSNRLNASICCNVSPENVRDHIPDSVSADELYFWETSLDALGLRQMPPPSSLQYSSVASLDWVLLQAGNTDEWYRDTKFIIGDYWSGRTNLLGPKYKVRPDRTKGRYINNQGGWMATREQIISWHMRWCRGGFLPPYDKPTFKLDGLGMETVEFWSGGIQIAGVMACNLQRFIPLQPEMFSRHLLYHSSNNKQRQKNLRYRFSVQSINQFWGQLNTIKKEAERDLRSQ